MTKQLAIITGRKSDLSRLLENLPGVRAQYIHPDEVAYFDLGIYDQFCVLGGTSDEPLVLTIAARKQLEEQIAAGKRVFGEYVSSLGMVYCASPKSTRFMRLLCAEDAVKGLTEGDILEDQCNSFIAPHFIEKTARPILIYREFVAAHSRAVLEEKEKADHANWGLFLERDNLMLCSFRICDFLKARFSPMSHWRSLVKYIIAWLTGVDCHALEFAPAYTTRKKVTNFEQELSAGISSAVSWYSEAGMLRQNGRNGVFEGLATEIYPDGSQKKAVANRADCAGEASLAFLTDYLLTGCPASLEKSNHLEHFCYDAFQITEGPFKGMLRWTDTAWEVCYQDDVARVLIPSLLKMLYTGNREMLPQVVDALDFLARTTGKDGLRPSRTDNIPLLEEGAMEELAQDNCGFACAHYNAFYSASLLLGGRLAKRQDFIELGVKGLEAIMAVYPQTIREQSETEELCRLILPLSWLFWTTGKKEHKDWLYQVAADLQKMRHPSGAYLEWDSDYSAAFSRGENSECSLLTENGDPVIDMLYSINWLPLGFSQAYLVTGDPYFKELWEGIANFLLRAQIYSENPLLNGAWTRGFDVERMEVYGIPNDVGWGPWAVESGWTMGEIIAGLGLGSIADTLKQYYQ